VPATSAALSRLLFLQRPWTVLIKQTRQAVHAFKQSILLWCLCLPRTNTLAYFGMSTSDNKETFHNIDALEIFSLSLSKGPNKLEPLSLANISSLVLYFRIRPEIAIVLPHCVSLSALPTNIRPWPNVIKLLQPYFTNVHNKIDCLCLESVFNLV